METGLNVRWHLLVLELSGSHSKAEFCTVVKRLQDARQETRSVFVQWVSAYSRERFQRLVLSARKVLGELVGLRVKCRSQATKRTSRRWSACASY